jgi:large subunit ribosomal protein L23
VSQHLDRYYNIIKSPHLTEKSTNDNESRNAYHFRVPVDANKIEIRNAVEALFKVQVAGVNTLRKNGKSRRRGWVAGKKQDWKKAMVTLEDGQTIDIF